MAEHENQRCNLCMGFLIGGVLGALAGILFAPKSGKELRSDMYVFKRFWTNWIKN
jgi:gas vesicle protein